VAVRRARPRVPSLLWAAVLGLYVAIEISELPRRLTAELEIAFQIALILSVTLTLASFVMAFIGLASERRALGGPVTGLAQTAARVTILVVGVLAGIPDMEPISPPACGTKRAARS
jgi:hypothetical protein